MYLTNLTNETIKVYKTDNKRLKLSGISSDSRSIKKGMLFAVIKGEKNKRIENKSYNQINEYKNKLFSNVFNYFQ